MPMIKCVNRFPIVMREIFLHIILAGDENYLSNKPLNIINFRRCNKQILL